MLSKKLVYKFSLYFNRVFPAISTLDVGRLSQKQRYHEAEENVNAKLHKISITLVGGLGFGMALEYFRRNSSPLHAKDLPIYRKSDIAKHTKVEDRVWVHFQGNVYDVTDFIESHPGGNKILLAAGKDLEPYFKLYAVHNSDHVQELLTDLQIGTLHPDEVSQVKEDKTDDTFKFDPIRSPTLTINSSKPFNAEPPPSMLCDYFNTPNELFFIRNHLPVPEIDESKFALQLSGVGLRRKQLFTMKQLKKRFKKQTISAAIQCAGNRRSQMSQTKAVKGLSWGTAAISNAEWGGVYLHEVLKYLGINEDQVNHVIFQGKDKDIEGVYYEASIPAETAFDPRREVLLAYEMNGEPLPLDHGFPLRVIVPGVVGARQVKWLEQIILDTKECQGHWQQGDYKSFNPSVDWKSVNFGDSVAIQDYPLQSAICDTIFTDESKLLVKGYAWSGGGRGIIRVDVSIDGGESWTCAKLNRSAQKMHREWAWTLWELEFEIPPGLRGKELDVVCKAVDTSHNSQPESCAGIWNLRGLINNAWHHVNLSVPK